MYVEMGTVYRSKSFEDDGLFLSPPVSADDCQEVASDHVMFSDTTTYILHINVRFGRIRGWVGCVYGCVACVRAFARACMCLCMCVCVCVRARVRGRQVCDMRDADPIRQFSKTFFTMMGPWASMSQVDPLLRRQAGRQAGRQTVTTTPPPAAAPAPKSVQHR